MNMKQLLYRIKPPCAKCPYKLGVIQTFANPCPECRMNGYQTFAYFAKHYPNVK